MFPAHEKSPTFIADRVVLQGMPLVSSVNPSLSGSSTNAVMYIFQIHGPPISAEVVVLPTVMRPVV